MDSSQDDDIGAMVEYLYDWQGVLFEGVLVRRALLFGVLTGDPDF